jgi:FKBP-type peptidyl-prolyl cis-trans isomerase 2
MFDSFSFLKKISQQGRQFSLFSLIVLVLMLFSGGASDATTLNVPSIYATIQAAVTASTSGDIVVVAPGTYTGAGNVDIDFGGKNINVMSSGGAAVTVIDCQGSAGSPHKGFYIHSGETGAVINGFTIQNGYDANLGSGIAVIAATVTISQCIIQNCTGRSGGGAYVSSLPTTPFTPANVTITDCVLKSNSGFQGGGLYSNASNCAISQSDFVSNVASSVPSPSTTYGGGIEITKNNSNTVTATVTDCVFISNSTQADGGAIDMASNNANQTVKVYNCSFYGNTSGSAGTGTISFFNGTNTVRNCIFYGDVSSKEVSTASPPSANVVQYCDVNQSGYAGLNNNINADPLYVDPANKNLHLQSGSPCIGVGTSTGAPSVDHDNVAWTPPISMGAFDASTVLSATHFSVSAPGSATAGSSFNVTVTALDSGNGTDTSYSGTVHFTSSDGAAVLPADATLTNGVGTFSVTLTTAGSQTVTATDTVSSSITGTSGAIIVSGGAADHYVVSAPGSATAGSPFNFSVTAVDLYGNTDTSYAGTAHFTSTDGAATLPADATLTNGVGTFSVTLTTAGSQTVTATDTVTSSITGTSGAIVVGADAADHFVVSASGSATAGSAFNVTVTAQDAYGNTDTSYAGTVHFTSTDGGAVLPANATLTNGVGTFSVTLTTAGSQTVTATDTVTSSITGTSSAIVVGAATADHFVVSAPGSATAGSSFSMSVAAKDAYGNTDTSYAGIAHFTSTDAAATLPADAALINGAGTFIVTLKTAGSQTVTATDTVSSSITGTSGAIVVDAATADHFVVSAPSSATAGSSFNVTVTAKDTYGNTDTSYAGTAHFTSSDGAAVLPADSTLTNGVGTFSVTLKTAGSQTVTATDTVTSSITGTSGAIVVGAGAANHFAVSALSTMRAGSAYNITVTAKDAYGNTATGYAGTVHLTSSDTVAILPADATLTNGVGTFRILFRTAGGQTITATDTVNSAITGTAAITVTAGPAVRFVLTAPSSTQVGGVFNVTVMAKDALGNTVPGYAGTVHLTSSDTTAILPADAALTNGVGTFRVILRTTGRPTITATDTVNSAITGAVAITATAGPAARFVLTAPNPTQVGAVFNVTVTAKDALGNTATGYAGTVHLTSSDTTAILPADATLTNGVGTFRVIFRTTGRPTITATDTVNSAITGAVAIVATAGPAARFVLSALNPTQVGAVFNVTVTAKDALGNTATGYAGTVHLTSSDTAAILPADATLTNGVGTFRVIFRTAGRPTITAMDTVNSAITGAVAIVATAGPATRFVLSAPSSTPVGGAFNVTVTAKDALGNTVTGYAGTVHLTSSDTTAILPADATLTNGAGLFRIIFRTTGRPTITATDTVNSAITGAVAITATAGPAARFVLSAPSSTQVGAVFNVTVTAKDALGNTVTGYAGTVHLTSSDRSAILAADATLTNGVGTFQVTLKTTGRPTIAATDTVNSAITGSAAVVVNAAVATRLLMSAPVTVKAGSEFSLVATAKDAYGNIATG